MPYIVDHEPYDPEDPTVVDPSSYYPEQPQPDTDFPSSDDDGMSEDETPFGTGD